MNKNALGKPWAFLFLVLLGVLNTYIPIENIKEVLNEYQGDG